MRKVKDILRLKFEAGLSHERIAAAVGLSKGAVTHYLQRAARAGELARGAGIRRHGTRSAAVSAGAKVPVKLRRTGLRAHPPGTQAQGRDLATALGRVRPRQSRRGLPLQPVLRPLSPLSR